MCCNLFLDFIRSYILYSVGGRPMSKKLPKSPILIKLHRIPSIVTESKTEYIPISTDLLIDKVISDDDFEMI